MLFLLVHLNCPSSNHNSFYFCFELQIASNNAFALTAYLQKAKLVCACALEPTHKLRLPYGITKLFEVRRGRSMWGLRHFAATEIARFVDGSSHGSSSNVTIKPGKGPHQKSPDCGNVHCVTSHTFAQSCALRKAHNWERNANDLAAPRPHR